MRHVAQGRLTLDMHEIVVVVHVEGASAVSTTFQTTTAAISMGFPARSLTFNRSLFSQRSSIVGPFTWRVELVQHGFRSVRREQVDLERKCPTETKIITTNKPTPTVRWHRAE